MSQADDPARLADAPASSRSPLGELLASASRDVPSEEQLARLAAQLGPVLDGAPGAPPATPGPSTLVKLAIATGTVALLVGAGLSLRRSAHQAPALPAVTPSAPTSAAAPLPARPVSDVAAPPAPALQPAPSADDASSTRTIDKPGAESSKSPASPSKAPNEAALLEQARRALSSSPSYALQLANQHRARFPNGVLTQEREVIAIEALRRMHRNADADQRAAGFSKAFPGSAHQRMVDEVVPK
ncbi:MAG TPA: hypothetical protein VER04_30245 [Polyangiaceae bacterium]|nr:hypothetical protein [Polyangiaceae bacterium]